jgi:hypothetical protein
MEALAHKKQREENEPQPDSARVVADASEQVREILAEGVLLAGRTWFPMRAPTFEQQQIRTRVVGRSGIMRLFPTFDGVNDDPDGLAAAVMATAFANGVLFEMLGALLVERDMPWTPAVAQANALFFASLTEPEDHGRLAESILWLVLDFFLNVSASTTIFLKSLVLVERSGNGSERTLTATPAKGRTIWLRNTTSEGNSAETSTSADGTTSSAPSPDSAESTS